jgi:ribosome-associated protein
MPEIKENFTETAGETSKSQRRRDALELKSLARDLIAMSRAQLARVPLDEDVRAAIDEAQQIRSNVARKRQLQYVAKLIRRSDATPIIEAIEALENDTRQLSARQHRVEAWRDHLISEGDPALSELLLQRPGADTQAIRQCIRKALTEAARDKPPAAARVLFRLLREMDENEPLPSLATHRR